METLVALLAATVITVPIARRLGFGSIVGYLAAGVAIGPSGLGLVTEVARIRSVSEFGVVMLLFLIGLEIRPHRLWILRRTILGLGFGQVLPSAAVIALLVHVALGLVWPASALLGLGLALSSTAIVLPMLNERGLLSAAAGRDAFAVLLFQDMLFVPLMALVPVFGGAHLVIHMAWLAVLRGLLAIGVIVGAGAFVVDRLFRIVGSTRSPEVFTATTLLLVVGTAALAHWAGLSASLGAFLAGALLSDSEFRHAIQADIEPFEGLLLGFFFISIGMSVDFGLIAQEPVLVAGALAVLLAVKIAVGAAVSYAKRRSLPTALRFALALPEGSEFGFVLFGAAASAGVIVSRTADLATLVVALSMIATPLIFAGAERVASRRLVRPPAPAEAMPETPGSVIICGFGRMGQIVGRLLAVQGIAYTALDHNPEHVAFVRRFGAGAYFGDPTRESVLRAAGALSARLLVVTLDDPESVLKVAEMARRHFPHLTVIARARNRRHAQALMALGITRVVRETLHSSLVLGAAALEALDFPAREARRTVEIFRERDEILLAETLAFASDEQRVIASVRQSVTELQELFEADRRAAADAQEGAEAADEARTS